MRGIKTAAILMVISVVVAACMGSSDDESVGYSGADDYVATTTVPEVSSGEPTGGEQDAGADEEGAGSTDAQRVVADIDPADLGRSIVYTANLTVEVVDVVAAGEQVRAVVAPLGGILFGQETTTGPDARSVLTIKVLPEHFNEALGRLAGVGTLISQTVYADDVTERVVDLRSRITTAEASVERLRGFLEDATDLEDVALLEEELLRRETDLELLRGQLRTLEDQVALATIILVLTEPSPGPAIELIETGYAAVDGGQACPGLDELEIDEGERFTVCLEVVNTGNTPLADVEVRDSGLDLDPDDFTVVAGDPGAPLPPGGRLLFAADLEAELRGYTSPTVTAVAVGDDGQPVHESIETTVDRLELRIIEDTSLPGFGDALAAAWRTLQSFFGVLVVMAGAAVPFLWVPVLVAGAVWYLRRRRTTPEPPAPPEPPTV